MAERLRVNKYQVAAVFKGGVLEWRWLLQTADGQSHELPVRDGEEVPVLLDIARREAPLYYDPQGKCLSTEWNQPGR